MTESTAHPTAPADTPAALEGHWYFFGTSTTAHYFNRVTTLQYESLCKHAFTPAEKLSRWLPESAQRPINRCRTCQGKLRTQGALIEVYVVGREADTIARRIAWALAGHALVTINERPVPKFLPANGAEILPDDLDINLLTIDPGGDLPPRFPGNKPST